MEIVNSIDSNVYKNQFNSQKASNQDPFNVVGKDDADARLLGIGFLHVSKQSTAYGMRAEYAENYSEDNPIIKVTLQKGNGEVEEYNIGIRDVNPKNATEIEMFALCNYADAKGTGTGGPFGSWTTLNYYRHNASLNGNFEMTNTTELFKSLKQDWSSMVEDMITEYMNGRLFKQALDGKKLLEILGTQMDKLN